MRFCKFSNFHEGKYRLALARGLKNEMVKSIIIVLLSFLIVCFYAGMALNLKFLSPIANVMKDFSMTDIYYQALWQTSKPDTSRIVTIVDLTDQYYRPDISQTIRDIESCHPKVLGIDAVFEGDRDDIGANLDLMDVVGSNENIICSYKLYDYDEQAGGYHDATCIHSFFRDMMSINEGFTNMPRQLYGGIKREVTLGEKLDGKPVPSFALKVCNTFIGKDKALPVELKNLNINFSPKEFVVLKPDEVLKHPELIEDRVVLYGSMYEEGDMHYTPLAKMAGVKLLAYAVETILLQNAVKPVPLPLSILVTFFLVWMIYWGEKLFTARTSKSKYPFVVHFIGSSYFVGLLVFAWTVVLMGISFLLFSMSNISFSLALTIATSAFLSTSQSFYKGCVESLIKSA